jgi:HlyD family secretion protein
MRVATERRKSQKEYDEMLEMAQTFQIERPEPGMVVYHKGFDGKPIKAGSQMSTWDPCCGNLARPHHDVIKNLYQ